METIDITQILSQDLKSRIRVHDLKQFIVNSRVDNAILDFCNVKFATRSFMDEFYNVFLKYPAQNPFNVKIINVPADIKIMLDTVSKTQIHTNVIDSFIKEISFNDLNKFLNYISTAQI